ncbi:hypothetical protein HY409_02920 [Candidatus Gottesmanbacteria bacterium]|nr:hypothetical protein [Candidatus Gottesmanbacteria bacterium]
MSVESPSAVHFTPIPFFLSQSPNDVRFQFAQDTEIMFTPRGNLARSINTDTIIPADACKTPDPDILAEYVLTGWQDGAVKPGDVKLLWPNVWVAGAAFGSGSSREHAPVAMQHAGCGLVVAESFAPIFRRNATALGLYTSTNFGLIDRIRNGQSIPLSELVREHDPLSQDILRKGGLLPYLQALSEGKVEAPKITTGARPMTIAEKWLSQSLGVPFVQPGDGGFAQPGKAYSYEYTLPLSEQLLKDFQGDDIRIADPSQIVLFNDHLALDTDPRSASLEKTTRDFAQRHKIPLYDTYGGTRPTTQGNLGICHVVMMDKVTPGINVGTDSHTPMIAPVGGFVFGIGATDFAGLMLTGKVLAIVPESVRVNLTGKFQPYVTARDLMLHLSATDARQKRLHGKVIEFSGSSLNEMTLLDLAIMSNMSAEARALTAVFPPLTRVADYLVKTRRATSIDQAFDLFPIPDQYAEYADTLNILLSTIEPTVALPSQPEHGVPLSQMPDIKFNKVIIGACVGGGIEDVRIAAHILQGHSLADGVELVVHPHSLAALKYAEQQGWLDWIRQAGGTVVEEVGCGACIGNGPGTLGEYDVCMTTDSRNHDGRMGHSNAKVYLASSVVSSIAAITGKTPAMDDIYRYTKSVPWDDKAMVFSV